MNSTVEAIKTYFKGVKTEWGKVSWPERRQVIAETFAVIFITFAFTVAIYVIDLIFKGRLFRAVFFCSFRTRWRVLVAARYPVSALSA